MEEISLISQKNALKTCDNIRKIATGPRDDQVTGCLLNYPYFKEHYKLITIDVTKKQLKQFQIFQKQQLQYYGFILF